MRIESLIETEEETLFSVPMPNPRLEVTMSNPYIRVTLACLICFTLTPRSVHGEPVTNVYEIVSGEAGWCCGIAGEFRTTLPNDSESYVWLVTDSAQPSARMILFGLLYEEPISLIVNNGRIYSDYIEFGMPGPFPPFPAPGTPPLQHYIASNTASGIRFNGLTVYPVFGADVPNRFWHSNVVATLLTPTPVRPTIRVSQVEVCWESSSNRIYQVQYRSSFTSNTWVNLQSTVFGNGGTRCIVDRVDADQPRRFYRVLPVP